MTATVEGDGSQILVEVADGAITSITGMGEGEIVSYNGNTYQLFGNIIKVITADGVELYSEQDESTNLVELAETGDIVYIPYADGKLNVADGIAALAEGKKVYYGSAEDFAGEYEVEITGDGTYALTAVEGVEPSVTVDASTVDGEVAITADFATQVETCYHREWRCLRGG